MAPITSLASLLLLGLCHASANDASATTRRRAQSTGVTLSGIVYYDVNQNSNKEPNENGVPNVTVQIRSCINERMGSTRTNALGEFFITLDDPGCYYARLDVTANTFSPEGDVNPINGRTEQVTLEAGQAAYWYAGIIPEEGSGITANPTKSPSDTPEPTTPIPTEDPTASPTTKAPTTPPTLPAAPTDSPTTSLAPTPCIVTDVVENNIMGSSPIMRSSFGMLFSLSTPTIDEATGGSDVIPPNADENVRITSFSLRTKSPIMSKATSTNYKVYYRPGGYKKRGDLDGWTLVAEGNSIGEDKPDEGTEAKRMLRSGTRMLQDEKTHEPLIQDTAYFSGAFPSDNNDYASQPTSMKQGGGMETLNAAGNIVTTYLYQIPKSIFTPVEIPKFGGKASFYVTFDRALMQYGDADRDDWDSVDVENAEYDASDKDDMNVRIHVGEGVTSNPWSDIDAFYTPRRFLGKVWYEQVRETPCHLHESAPSMSPSILTIPPLPGEEEGFGEKLNTNFVVSIFLQKDITDVTRMNAEVQSAFKEVMMDFLNEEWVFDHCVWGTDPDITYQTLSLLKGVNTRGRHLRGGLLGGLRRHLMGGLFSGRQLQTDVTILQVEMNVDGVAYYDDPRVCPSGSIPARPTTAGSNWDETMSSISVDFITDNVDRLSERLRNEHEYFDDIFAVAADPDLLERPDDNVDGVAAAESEDEGGSVPLVPIVAGAAGAVVVLLLGCFVYTRRRKRQSHEEFGGPTKGELGSETPGDTAQDDSLEPKEGDDGEEAAEQAPKALDDSDTLPLEEDEGYLGGAWPTMQKVPELEDIILSRGLPRRRSEPSMQTILPDPDPIAFKRSRSIGCIREIWINLNKEMSSDVNGSYFDAMVNGTLYPIDDPDLLYFEREAHIMGNDLSTPYVQHGADIMHNYIDEADMERIEHPPAPQPEKRGSQDSSGAAEIKAPVKINPLVMQQVEMLEAKWKQLREEYDDDEDSDDENDLENFDVNNRIEQLMGRIEQLELERKMRLNELKRQEEEEEELARKRMVKAGEGINYEQEFKKEFVIRKKKKKKTAEDLEIDEMSEESSSEEEESDGEFDVKWMRLKVPLAHQEPEAMKGLVEKGEELG